jgi:hypothetical protein
LKEITKTLYNVGKVQNVYVVTLTKTRSKRWKTKFLFQDQFQ